MVRATKTTTTTTTTTNSPYFYHDIAPLTSRLYFPAAHVTLLNRPLQFGPSTSNDPWHCKGTGEAEGQESYYLAQCVDGKDENYKSYELLLYKSDTKTCHVTNSGMRTFALHGQPSGLESGASNLPCGEAASGE
jgi:hypothetical protein